MRRASPYLLGALLVLAGVNHAVNPDFYDALIPGWLGDPRPWVLGSGAVEVVVGALVLAPRTRRAGALAALVLLVAVFPGNVTAVVNAGSSTAELVAWLRLPLQVPLLLWAWQVHRDARPATVPA